jgi:hypothetical protein
MTKEELQDKIQDLIGAASGLAEPDKTFALGEVDRLKIKVEGMALADLRHKLEQIKLPDLQEIDTYITAAKDAASAHQLRVDALNSAIGLLKKGVGMLL